MFRILVVTDVVWTRNEVHSVLTTPDFELIDSDDPRTAPRLAYDENLDAAVVDLQTGSMGGMAVAREIRNLADLADRARIPTVLLLDRAADGFLALRAGAVDWLVKPLQDDTLAVKVRAAISGDPTGPDPEIVDLDAPTDETDPSVAEPV